METGTALNLNVILPLLFLWLSDIVSVSLRTLTGTDPAISMKKRPKLNLSWHLTKRKNRRYRHRHSDWGSSQRPNLRLRRSVGSCPNLRETPPKSPSLAECFEIFSKELSNKPKALFCIRAPAKLWLQNDSRTDATANLEIVHGKRKTHTSLVQRCGRLRKSLREKLNGPRRRDPEFLNATDVVPVFDGEVRNQTVITLSILEFLCSKLNI